MDEKMKVQLIYSSLSGSTKKLAEGIYKGLVGNDKSIHDLKDGVPSLDADILLLGYWVDKGGPNDEMKVLMEGLENKVIGVFCTLAYFVDSTHGHESLKKGIELVKDKNTVLGSYVCNGRLSDKLIENFRKAPKGGHHSATPQSEKRWEIMKKHPTELDIALAVERFNERITFYSMLSEDSLEYKSLT